MVLFGVTLGDDLTSDPRARTYSKTHYPATLLGLPAPRALPEASQSSDPFAKNLEPIYDRTWRHFQL